MTTRLLERLPLRAALAALLFSAACDQHTPIAPPTAGPAATRLSIVPSAGRTEGGTAVRISGTEFLPGASVSFDGASVAAEILSSGTTLLVSTPPHAAGTVEVVVRNPGGFGGTVSGGYTYIVVAALAITAISPDHGSVDGGTPVRLTGSGFHADTHVSLDGVPVAATAYLNNMFFVTPAHHAGPIDVVVSNPGGESVSLVGGFTYVSIESLILDGTWVGWAGDLHVPVTFTIQNNAVTSVRCDLAPPILLSPPVPIRQARFSIDQDGVSVMSGMFHSNQYGLGDINIGTCQGRWDAERR